MLIDSALWCAKVGIFNAFRYQTQRSSNTKNSLLFLKILLIFINYIFAGIIYFISFSTFRFLTHVLKVIDAEILFYCKLKYYYIVAVSSLTFCHWNLNGIAAHEFIKSSLLQGYIIEHNFEIIRLSETFLNSFFDSEDDRLKIEGWL